MINLSIDLNTILLIIQNAILCAQARSCFGENPFVCTSVLIVCTSTYPLKVIVIVIVIEKNYYNYPITDH